MKIKNKAKKIGNRVGQSAYLKQQVPIVFRPLNLLTTRDHKNDRIRRKNHHRRCLEQSLKHLLSFQVPQSNDIYGERSKSLWDEPNQFKQPKPNNYGQPNNGRSSPIQENVLHYATKKMLFFEPKYRVLNKNDV